MKVSREWLKDIIGKDVPGNEIADKIILNGMEVEKLIHTGNGEQDIVSVEILEVNKHPEADNLSVTKADAGKYGTKQIVTNVKGLKKGDKVLAAMEGVRITDDFIIKKAKLRSVESEGMFIGWNELNIPSKSDGLIFLDNDTPAGKKYYEVAPFIDEIVDIELTANRGDCLGMYGIGREIAVLFDGRLKSPEQQYPTKGNSINDFFKVRIETDSCSRYCGAVIKNVKIAPSPLWLQLRIIKGGIRPINNIVDITNYVMLEMNQPLHAFDMDKIMDRTVVVRNGRDGERITTLDDIERTLNSDDILIADPEKGHCLGGIMGGSISEISAETVNVFLEAAFFNPAKIRRTSKRLGLRSDSSYRFERTIDIENVAVALKRALSLISLLDIGDISPDIIDAYPRKYTAKHVNLDSQWINRKLGTDISLDRMISILKSLDYRVESDKITIPSWRSDVSIKEDISEEIARIYGYNNIVPTITPSRRAGMRTDKQDMEKSVRELCYKSGCNEVFNFSFVGDPLFNLLGFSEESPYREFVRIEEPLSDDFQGMRNTLFPGMLRTCSFNAKRQNRSLSIFETGAVSFKSCDILPVEKKHLAVLVGGIKHKKDHTGAEVRYDFYDIKGILDRVELEFGVKFILKPSSKDFMHPYQQASILIGETNLGFVGQVHTSVLKRLDIDFNVFIFEIDLDLLFKSAQRSVIYSEIPRFPSSERDMAIVVDQKVTAGQILETIKMLKLEHLQSVTVFDRFEGGAIEDGYYSLGLNLSFNKITATLKDEEIDEDFAKVLKSLESEFGAKIR